MTGDAFLSFSSARLTVRTASHKSSRWARTSLLPLRGTHRERERSCVQTTENKLSVLLSRGGCCLDSAAPRAIRKPNWAQLKSNLGKHGPMLWKIDRFLLLDARKGARGGGRRGKRPFQTFRWLIAFFSGSVAQIPSRRLERCFVLSQPIFADGSVFFARTRCDSVIFSQLGWLSKKWVAQSARKTQLGTFDSTNRPIR